MALWGLTDASGSAPKYTTTAANGNTGSQDFGTVVFGVDENESQAARSDGKGSVAPGWVRKVTGTGGRAGRVTHETLVAMSSQGGISTDAEDVAFPDLNIVVSSQPAAVSVTSPADAVFTVTAATVPTGGTISYQWQVSTDSGSTWASTVDADGTSATLTVVSTDAEYVTANQFRVVMTATGADSVTSSAAELTVA